MTLVQDEVHLWFSAPAEVRDPALLRACQDLLSQDELARMQQFRFARHRHLHLVAHAWKRAVLSHYADVAPGEWRFIRNGYGRPEVAVPAGVPALRCNLSHCDDLVLFGVSLDQDIGVDVESAARGVPSPEVARQFYAEREYRDWMAAAPEQRPGRFFAYWTLKEAYLKARGLGLHLPTTGFAFRLEQDGGIAIDFDQGLDDDPRDWCFWQFRPGAGQHAALALRGRRRTRPRTVCRHGVPLREVRVFSCEMNPPG